MSVLRSLSLRVELRLIKHISTDLRSPWQLGLAAHKRRRARECRKVIARQTYMPVIPGVLSRND